MSLWEQPPPSPSPQKPSWQPGPSLAPAFPGIWGHCCPRSSSPGASLALKATARTRSQGFLKASSAQQSHVNPPQETIHSPRSSQDFIPGNSCCVFSLLNPSALGTGGSPSHCLTHLAAPLANLQELGLLGNFSEFYLNLNLSPKQQHSGPAEILLWPFLGLTLCSCLQLGQSLLAQQSLSWGSFPG